MGFFQFKKSLFHAMNGIRVAYEREQNFRIHFFFACAAILAALFLQCSSLEWVMLSSIIISVFVGELMNTATEHLIDLVKPRLSEHAKIIKDCMAGAIFLLSLNAVIVGFIIFFPKLIRFFLG